MQEAPYQLNHTPAARFLRGHGPADQVQLLSLRGPDIGSTACAHE
jgi:hypothetical protein